MILQVGHRTTYDYAQPVSISHHVLHLSPRASPWQNCLRSVVEITPPPSLRRDDVDYFGNPVTYVTLEDSHRRLVVDARSTIEVATHHAPELDGSPPWEEVAAVLPADKSAQGLDIYQYAFTSPFTVARAPVAEYARSAFRPGRPILAAARELTAMIHRDFAYDATATTVTTPVDAVFAQRRGVCQDFAHLQLACLRALGLAARYVSGYLMTRPPPGQERLAGADASHAWVAVWGPGTGWLDLDPTNDTVAGDGHVTIAWGRDYGDVSPIKGVVFGGGEHAVHVAVDVAPVL